MVFSSLIFVFLFLPAVCILYFLARNEYRNYILLAASILFYAYGERVFIFVMLASILVNYLMARAIGAARKKVMPGLAKFLLWTDVVMNIGLLFVYKYLDFGSSLINSVFGTNIPMRNIALPIGISFFTFQALSYVIDVYRGVVPVQKNPLYVALYISFFPQLVAGPIVRYSTIAEQIDHRTCSPEKFGEGASRFFVGFCKKVILANNLALVSEEIFRAPGGYAEVNTLLLWLGSICFSLQIFYDFSGYSDMAIGMGKMFGFEFEENFNYPYISKTVTEFWRRWHISLGKWFRDYVYIPLGGSRVSIPRNILNLFIVWLLTGIWHGASIQFVVWGGVHFLLIVIEKYIIRPEGKARIVRIFWQIVTLLVINFGWVMFNAPDTESGIQYCLAMVGHYGLHLQAEPHLIYYLQQYGFYLLCGVVCATPVMKKLSDSLKRTSVGSVAVPIAQGTLFLWAVSFLILGAHNPFIYFNF